MEKNYSSCAECQEFSNVLDCKKYNNFISKVIGFVLRSNRSAGILRIKELGLDGFASDMAEKKLQSMKR